MLELDPANILDYLRSAGRIGAAVPATVEPLSGGVSNVVLRICVETGDDLVIKQSRRQLRTPTAWFSRLDRIWREADVMRHLASLLPAGAVPAVLFEDRENYLFGMAAVDADHAVWKSELLAGKADPAIASTAAGYLSAIHRATCGDAALLERWGDREVFEQLRVDPFYRHIAAAHPDIRPQIEALVEELRVTSVCAVHADFSPKNMLISRRGVTLVDFETAHFGDPAFDLGFFLSHLLLKTVFHAQESRAFLGLARTFWQRYVERLEDPPTPELTTGEGQCRAIGHLAGCMLARIDGTSTVDYLTEPGTRDFVRQFCRELFLDPPATMPAAFDRLEHQINAAEL